MFRNKTAALPPLKEQAIVNQILDWLDYMKIPAVHVRNTGALIRRDGKTFFGKPRRSQKGVPDILCCVKGRAVGIEVKNATGTVSDEQYAWQQTWGDAGGFTVIARRLEVVEEFIGHLVNKIRQIEQSETH